MLGDLCYDSPSMLRILMEALFDYSSITEAPGLKATQEQLTRLYHRYRFAQEYTDSRDVLEIGCGCGVGLGFLSQKARAVIGGDIDKKNVRIARKLYEDSPICIQELDAHNLSFEDGSFDLVLLFEAIYYLRHPEIFVQEAKRVLRKDGVLIICTVNKDWPDFHPSPYTYKYFSVPELYNLLKSQFTKVQIFGAFPSQSNTFFEHCKSLLKRIAVQCNLIPCSLRARAYLKRIFFGPLKPIPAQIFENMAPYEPPISLPSNDVNTNYKIIYAVAKNC
jgi:SAM-dependent methyltransferase